MFPTLTWLEGGREEAVLRGFAFCLIYCSKRDTSVCFQRHRIHDMSTCYVQSTLLEAMRSRKMKDES